MKLAVVGSRGWKDYDWVTLVLQGIPCTEIVTGGAAGADKFAEEYAREHKIPVTVFYPDWDMYGKRAGAIRNRKIVDHCDLLVAFWDGKSKGTRITINMAREARKLHGVYGTKEVA